MAHPQRIHETESEEISLWAEIEPYIRGLMGDDDPLLESPVLREQAKPSGAVKSSMLMPVRTKNTDVDQAPTELNENETLAMDVDFAPQVTDVIQEDIEQIKERYILGKIVGRELFDSQGTRFARQGERISRQIIRLAEESGQLVDLIEQMTFDSYED